MIGLQINVTDDSVAFTCLGIAVAAAIVSAFYLFRLRRDPALDTAMVFSFSSVAGWLAASPFGNAAERASMNGFSFTWISSAATLWFGGLIVGYAIYCLAQLDHRHWTRQPGGSKRGRS